MFDDNETCLLNKGLNYNIPPTHRQQIFNEIISAESAIKAITDPNTQMESRHLINNKFVKTLNTYNDNKYYTQKQIKARDVYKRQVLKCHSVYHILTKSLEPVLESI